MLIGNDVDQHVAYRPLNDVRKMGLGKGVVRHSLVVTEVSRAGGIIRW